MLPLAVKLFRNSKIGTTRLTLLMTTLLALSNSAALPAETDWYSFTFDNDLFIGSDDGYTNGFYYSWYDTPSNHKARPGYLAKALLWSLPNEAPDWTISANTIGQTISTPNDITLPEPPLDDLPYVGLLFYSDSFITIRERQADRISVSVGLVGPSSGAEQTQKLVHRVTGSDDPEGWDSQLDNELVFQLSRARNWRGWISDAENFDILFGGNVALGTIQSLIGASVTLRYGRLSQRSFASLLLASTRTANPVAVNEDWYLFAGANKRYVFNQIFTDGNTFRDSRSIDYNKTQLAITLGIAYSTKNFAITFAINDLNVAASNSDNEIDKFSEFGTLTLAWRR